MRLNETEVNNYLRPFFGRYEDSFQQAWVEILESKPQTLEEVTPIIRRVRNKAIKQYLNKKYREVSLYTPIGKNRDEKFTLESVLETPVNENTEDKENGDNGLYKKIIDFLIRIVGSGLAIKHEFWWVFSLLAFTPSKSFSKPPPLE